MDLKNYYGRIQEVESGIAEPFVVVISLSTPDGGKAGVLTEAPRHVAAKQVAEGRARLASVTETLDFNADNARRRQEREEANALSRVQFVMMPQKPPRPVKE